MASRLATTQMGKWAVIAFAVLFAILLPALLNLLIAPQKFRDEMPGGPNRSDGLFYPPGAEYGFFSPEKSQDRTTYRWTGDHATGTFAYTANLGRYADITPNLAANVAPSQQPVAGWAWKVELLRLASDLP